MRVVYGRLPYELRPRRARAGRDGAARRLPDRGDPRAAQRRRRRSATRSSRTSRPGHLDPRLAEELGVEPGTRLRPAAARRDRRGRHARAGDGRRRARGARSCSPATPRHARRSTIAAHQADVLVHEATFLRRRPSAPRRRCTAPRARPPSSRATRRCGCSRSRTSPAATPAASCATRRARCSRDTEAPRDFDTIEVPFPERGPGAAMRWRAAVGPARPAPSHGQRSSADDGRTAQADRARPSEIERFVARPVPRPVHAERDDRTRLRAPRRSPCAPP